MKSYLKNTKLIAGFLLVFALSNQLNAQYDSTNWVLAKDQNEIEVYTREVENKTVKEFKAVCKIKTSLESLCDLYYDMQSKPDWVFACESAKVLEVISSTEKIIYVESYAPWPVKNRDVIINTVLTQNPETNEIIIEEKGIPDFISKNSGIIRIPEYEGFYSFKPISNGYVEVTFQCFSDPGGKLPDFLVNVSTIDNPFDTLTKMKELLENKKY